MFRVCHALVTEFMESNIGKTRNELDFFSCCYLNAKTSKNNKA